MNLPFCYYELVAYIKTLLGHCVLYLTVSLLRHGKLCYFRSECVVQLTTSDSFATDCNDGSDAAAIAIANSSRMSVRPFDVTKTLTKAFGSGGDLVL